MTVVALLGATGFVGRHVAAALQRRGAEVYPVEAPRLAFSGRDSGALAAAILDAPEVTASLASSLAGADVVVNAAGLATATSGAVDTLYGANALLPGAVARVCADAGKRFIHISSAAVQGRRPVLDETTDVEPFSPYSASKALGEALVLAMPGAIVFRPTSVQGGERAVTATLRRYAASRLAAVAAPGTDPTPQVHVSNVADAIAFTALTPAKPPSVVLQPAEGLTTASLLELLGDREARLIPRSLARSLVATLFLLGRFSGRFAGIARRLEMLWFGQDQVAGWLQGRWQLVATADDWRGLR